MLPWLLCIGLGLLALYLGGKVYGLRRTMEDIGDRLETWLDEDSNTLLTLTASRDPYARRLLRRLNDQLRLLRQQRRRWQQGDRELKEAVTNVAHDLRTPLTALCGYLDLLDRTEHDPDTARYLAQIQNRVEAMKQLTEELFRYSVLTAAPPLEREPVVLNRVLEESLLAHYGAFTQRGITPVLSLTDPPVRRDLDPTALRRILDNLFSNALKYSPGDLAVTLTAEGEITVSNKAPALDPVSVGRLFDRFYTVETGRSSTGLGLSIARLLTEAMGGELQARWQAGRLTMHLQFPGPVNLP